MRMCSVMSYSLRPPWTVARQAPLSLEFFRQEYWDGLPFLLQGIFSTQGSNSDDLPWPADSLPLSHWGTSQFIIGYIYLLNV